MSTCDVKSWRDSEMWSSDLLRSRPDVGVLLERVPLLQVDVDLLILLGFTIHLQVPLPGIPLQDLVIRVTLRSGLRHLPSQFIPFSVLSFNSTYIYDLGLLLLLPAGAASHVQERHLAPQPWEEKWSKQQVCEDWWKTFWIVLGFILKENLNPRVLYWW